MKKLVSMILAIALAVGMSSVAFAADNEASLDELGTQPIEVFGTYEAGSAGGVDYSVNITWTSMSFTYYGESKATWNTENHTYNGDERAAGWADDAGATITVTNHSNAFLKITPSYSKEASYSGAGMTFDWTAHINSAEVNNQAEQATITVTPTGELPENTDAQKIGTISLKIEQMKDASSDVAQNFLWSKENELTAALEAKNVSHDKAAPFNTLVDVFEVKFSEYEEAPSPEKLLKLNEAYVDCLKKLRELCGEYGVQVYWN